MRSRRKKKDTKNPRVHIASGGLLQPSASTDHRALLEGQFRLLPSGKRRRKLNHVEERGVGVIDRGKVSVGRRV